MKSNYWSNSKIANIVRGTIKPKALQMHEWGEWDNMAKEKHPFRYWLAEEFFNDVQDFINYIPKKINEVRYYLNNRFQTKTHALTSNMKKGQWHEFDDRILHCLFDEFVNFIEVETAWDHVAWNKDAQSKYAVPLFRKKWWLRWFNEWRCAEAGLDHLEWEMSLTNEHVHLLDPEYGKPTPQALAAHEKYNLYSWWKNIRPNRPDPYEISGWNEYCDKQDKEQGWRSIFNNRTDEDIKESRKLLDILHSIEEEYDNEDEQMLCRLIKIRRSLWT